MNIFYLDEDIETCAKFYCDKHVVKMILEYTQILSTTLRYFGYDWDFLYKSTHVNHPCCIWARESLGNFTYLALLAKNLCLEYNFRYNKIHKCTDIILDIAIKIYYEDENFDSKFKTVEFTEPPKCMPDEYKLDSVVDSYRNYYIKDKLRFAKWKNRPIPYWIDATENINI